MLVIAHIYTYICRTQIFFIGYDNRMKHFFHHLGNLSDMFVTVMSVLYKNIDEENIN